MYIVRIYLDWEFMT